MASGGAGRCENARCVDTSRVPVAPGLEGKGGEGGGRECDLGNLVAGIRRGN